MFRILIAIGQTPFDPTSGAAQATLHLAELLAMASCEVRCLATTGTEGVCRGDLPHGNFVESGVNHHIIPVDPDLKHSWHHIVGAEYNRCFDEWLADFKPHFVFSFGDEPPDQSRRARALAAGARLVFCLHNEHYTGHQPDHVSAFLCPSTYLANRYRSAWSGAENITVLPTPMIPARIMAATVEPVFVTFINPQPDKGLWFMIRFAGLLGKHHPEIPLRIVEGRATAADFLSAAKSVGVDLGIYPNLFFSHSVADVREIWSTSRILLAPAVWNEPAGRTPVEAMMNGVVPIVSDRGGLPEQVGTAGRVLPLPGSISTRTATLPQTNDVFPWVQAVAELCHDENHFLAASKLAQREAQRFSPEKLAPAYMAFLKGLMT
jgi:glycosyltransferase involved in cell wall biosynthesis